ncbi:MAG: molybdopterin molybdotransferase MoeA [Gammaproteobacteria bacterium]|nr:molybdopterin molybdotransferase MoeA [Gammaproteobacteria bacterium]
MAPRLTFVSVGGHGCRVWQDTPVISYEEALQLLRTGAALLPRRAVPAAAAAGEVTSDAVTARLTVPGFNNAAMDGYVLRAAATSTATPASPVRLRVSGLIAAGSAPPRTPEPATRGDEAWEIMTGAPVPATLDAVVPVERVRLEAVTGQPAVVVITSPLQPGQNVRLAGEDFVAGQTVLESGTRLAPHHLMGLAACGVDEVPVAARPRVAVLTTGSELEHQGASLGPGRIRDANGPYLQALLPLLGAAPVTVATAADEAAGLRDRLRQLAGMADLILTTGGVSAGRLDLLPDAVRGIGGEIVFHKVAIRPGKPVLHARLPGGAVLFGLPGNPLAVAVGMRFLVIPALRAMQGLAPECPTPAVTMTAVRGRGDLRFFGKAVVDVDAAGQRQVRILPGQESFRIAPLLRANCWAIVPEGVGEIAAGGVLQTLPLYPDDSTSP